MTTRQQAFVEICQSICQQAGWEFFDETIRVMWSDGRRQLVFLEFFENEGQEIVRLYTKIGPVEDLGEDRLIAALRVNAGLALGALAVIENDLVMIDTQWLQDADLEEVRASIDFLARTADSYEKSLFGMDVN